ncbi:amino acid ABC transporter permease [Szabonella alba]|uniref:Amino acid ABC transporter permease n=1 Tax=Szabonella alba TaxID=2804194 RepID=A0A8K0VBE4_9RHOB|nr:amino acid ABC transporter permease [Szabonella alba]MBL4918982.1 amino acid ABC transporter permease [Szabonella alba]
METVLDWLQPDWLLSLSVVSDDYNRGRYLSGLWMTVKLSVICIVLSLIVGIAGAAIQGAKSRALRVSVGFFVAFFRNTPPLVQLYFFYFAIGTVLRITGENGLPQPLVSNFGWAVISLSLFAGAMNIEIFRSGVEAVPKATIEAAEALGYTRLQIYRYIVLPLALRISMSALGTNLVNLVKTTTLVYAIAVPELLYVAAQIWSEDLNVREMMNVLLLSYVGIVAVLVWVLHRWEKALRIPGYGG